MLFQKPERFCVYCKTIIFNGKLKRHIRRKHGREPEVNLILTKPIELQNSFFESKRKEGIYEYNLRLVYEDKEPDMRERRPTIEDQLRVCTECKGFYSNKYFFKHKCRKGKSEPIKPKLLQKCKHANIENDSEFTDYLNRFRDGEVGNLIRNNDTIKLIGYRHFSLRRHEDGKRDEIRKVVMAEMRELARLYLKFIEIIGEDKEVEEMFSRDNLQELVDAIKSMVEVDGKKIEKHGTKLYLDAVILRSIKTLEGYFTEIKEDDKAKEIKMFKKAYKHRANELYPSARQACIKNSLQKLRRPDQLPNEEELKKMKCYVSSEIEYVTTNFNVKQYSWLRSLIVSRLTLFNARRGDEASRILVEEWENAEKNVWVPDNQVEKISDEAEKYLVGKYKLAYLAGKGKKFVPVLIPIDLIPGIRLLKANREAFGILENNDFLFATKSRRSHCSGGHALKRVCRKGQIDLTITATKMRHRISSLYSSLDMKPEDRKIFLEHMGHNEITNKENYACPPGVEEVRVMSRVLNCIDEGMVFLK